MFSAPFYSKGTGVYDKSYDHPISKQEMNAGCRFYEICVFVLKVILPLSAMVIIGRWAGMSLGGWMGR